MVNKEECKKLYRSLKNDIEDLESSNFRGLWFERVHRLKENGCWWHYSILMRKGREYLEGKGDYPSSLHSLFNKEV